MNTSKSCPQTMVTTLEVIGDKYTALIIMLLNEQDMRFSELLSAIPNITPRTLVQRLEKLKALRLIEKVACLDSPKRQSYHLLAPGKKLEVVIRAMEDWGATYMSAVGAAK